MGKVVSFINQKGGVGKTINWLKPSNAKYSHWIGIITESLAVRPLTVSKGFWQKSGVIT